MQIRRLQNNSRGGFVDMNFRHPIQAVCLALSISVFSAAQASATQTPASRRLGEWLAAYNGTDWNAYLTFLKADFAIQPGGGFRDPALRDRTGGYDLKKIESETPTEVTGLIQERAGDGFARVVMEVEPGEPHRILKLEVKLVERPAEFALPHMSDQQLVAAVRKRLEDESASDRFSGAVFVAKEGKPIFARAYGLADREHNSANTLQTQFSLASMNKMFTAVALMQQVQAGKVSLDDRLEKYLPDYPNKELAAKVTIGELLSNTGGTGDIWGPEFDKHRLELHTLRDYINLYGNRALRFEPGSRWEYSNYGFILIGAVIEKVSGQSYSDYVHQHVFNPAGMTATSLGMEDKAIPNLSIEYTKMGATHWIPIADAPINSGSSAGAGFSTVGDLLRFANALRENKLLDAQHTKLMTKGRVATPLGLDAYGFQVQTINGNQCFGHNGSSRGVNGDLKMCLNSSYAIVVLANMDPPAADQVSAFIAGRLPVVKSE
jgi:CubicO group peptidase (beta-lactamase class C family)